MKAHSTFAPSAHEPSPSEQWDNLVRRYEESEAAPLGARSDEQIELAGQQLEELMAMPAPNAQAARWKLDYFMADSHYEDYFVAQTVKDYRRFLSAPSAVNAIEVS